MLTYSSVKNHSSSTRCWVWLRNKSSRWHFLHITHSFKPISFPVNHQKWLPFTKIIKSWLYQFNINTEVARTNELLYSYLGAGKAQRYSAVSQWTPVLPTDHNPAWGMKLLLLTPAPPPTNSTPEPLRVSQTSQSPESLLPRKGVRREDNLLSWYFSFITRIKELWEMHKVNADKWFCFCFFLSC